MARLYGLSPLSSPKPTSFYLTPLLRCADVNHLQTMKRRKDVLLQTNLSSLGFKLSVSTIVSRTCSWLLTSREVVQSDVVAHAYTHSAQVAEAGAFL